MSKVACKTFFVAYLLVISLVATACSGVKGGTTGGSGASGGSGGSGTGGSGGSAGSGGSGASTGPFTIGGSVVGLTGSGLVLEDNGGDDVTVTGTGTVSFTFKTAVTGTYSVTIKTQPASPSQVCSVANSSGTATANVTNVQVSCAATYTVGGAVSGLQGSGLVLQDNGGDDLKINGTGTVNFTFATALLGGANYAVTIKTQPSNPVQTCSVANGSGTVIGSVTTVQVSCSQPKYPIGGTVVGLVVGNGDTLELQDNAGDNLFVTGDVDFTFPTQFTYGTTYSVDLFLPPTSQPQGCNIFNATAVVTGIVSNVLVDCQHNDWAWMFPGTAPKINSYGAATLPSWLAGTPIPAPPFPVGNPNTPGGRDFAMAWTDKKGSRWLFGGFGFEVTHTNTDGIPGLLNDMWVWPTNPSSGEDDGWWLPGAWIPADLPIIHDAVANTYSANISSLEFKGLGPVYGTQGVGTMCGVTNSGCTIPGARWGGITWTDASGNLWMFGGQGIDGNGGFTLLNDIWEFDLATGPCSFDATTGTQSFTNCQWIWRAGSSTGNQSTTAAFPGGRWGAASYTDSAGNVWMFGGQGYDSTGTAGLLNDLWKYNIASGVWTLVSGTTTANQNGSYPASAGTGGAGFTPGGRQTAVLWVDASGNIWLFGGFGLDSKGTSGTTQTGSLQIGSVLNDLWKYSQGTGQWTWVSGSNLANQNGVYGTQGISNAATNAAATNVPGSRWGAQGWLNPDGNLFFFGGFGYGSNATQPTGFMNDVWEYQLSTGEWIWWKGSIDVDQPGTYITSPFNYFQLNYTNNAVGARRGAAHWAPDPLGYVYMFGGEGYDSTAGGPYGQLNDLWRYLPFPTN